MNRTVPVPITPHSPSTVMRIDAPSKPLSSVIGRSVRNFLNRGSASKPASTAGHSASPAIMPIVPCVVRPNLSFSTPPTSSDCRSPKTM